MEMNTDSMVGKFSIINFVEGIFGEMVFRRKIGALICFNFQSGFYRAGEKEGVVKTPFCLAPVK